MNFFGLLTSLSLREDPHRQTEANFIPINVRGSANPNTLASVVVIQPMFYPIQKIRHPTYYSSVTVTVLLTDTNNNKVHCLYSTVQKSYNTNNPTTTTWACTYFIGHPVS